MRAVLLAQCSGRARYGPGRTLVPPVFRLLQDSRQAAAYQDGNAGGTHWAGWVGALRRFCHAGIDCCEADAEPAGSFYSCAAPDRLR